MIESYLSYLIREARTKSLFEIRNLHSLLSQFQIGATSKGVVVKSSLFGFVTLLEEAVLTCQVLCHFSCEGLVPYDLLIERLWCGVFTPAMIRHLDAVQGLTGFVPTKTESITLLDGPIVAHWRAAPVPQGPRRLASVVRVLPVIGQHQRRPLWSECCLSIPCVLAGSSSATGASKVGLSCPLWSECCPPAGNTSTTGARKTGLCRPSVACQFHAYWRAAPVPQGQARLASPVLFGPSVAC